MYFDVFNMHIAFVRNFVSVRISMEKDLCLGRFKAHSFDAWYWRGDEKKYHHACSLLGCSYSEAAVTLRPIGQVRIVDGDGREIPKELVCSHAWGQWRSTADRDGTYMPPYAYRRVCTACGAQEEVEGLEIES